MRRSAGNSVKVRYVSKGKGEVLGKALVQKTNYSLIQGVKGRGGSAD